MITGIPLQDIQDRPFKDQLYIQTGPIASCCGKPYRECVCPKFAEDNNPDAVTLDRRTSEAKTALALESIAVNLATLIKHLCPDALVHTPKSAAVVSAVVDLAVVEAAKARAQQAKERK